MTPLVGIFVGGAARRMGGVPKGLLAAPDGTGTLIERLARVCRQALPGARVVLVGSSPAYASLGLPMIADDPAGVGPLGGLRALLLAAGGGAVLALSCDLPFIEAALVRRIASEIAGAAAVAPRPDGIWEPLCACYAVEPCLHLATQLIAEGRGGLFRVLDALGDQAVALPLSPEERRELRDWDTPQDFS
jgi:molybdenum cofactor guanylyltransferase